MHPQPLTVPDSVDTCAATHAAAPEGARLFPPADADVETYLAWLARAAWPEVVFGARLPRARTAP